MRPDSSPGISCFLWSLYRKWGECTIRMAGAVGYKLFSGLTLSSV